MEGTSPVDSAMIARRMQQYEKQIEMRRKDPFASTKSMKEIVEEDEAILSGNAPEEGAAVQATAPQGNQKAPDQTFFNLSDLIQKLQALGNQAAQGQGAPTNGATVERTSVEVEFKMSYTALAPVEGLVKRNQNLAETDRYLFEFRDGATFTIKDKWTDRSTTVWGDPHVDVDDVEGNSNGEFSDLKSSNTHTTFQLLDGTQVIFKAKDNGVIEEVDISKGSQHLKGYGSGSGKQDEQSMLFSGKIDGNVSVGTQGDVVKAGGDGNDWFDSSGRMIWGKTTGLAVNARPAYTLQASYKQTITHEVIA